MDILSHSVSDPKRSSVQPIEADILNTFIAENAVYEAGKAARHNDIYVHRCASRGATT